ncbi:MAG: hypothetical protein FWE21_07055 [Defluviitaleaceae bacterium]|nr:hypothetical protein [Defluviitaleaceae bacterium]
MSNFENKASERTCTYCNKVTNDDASTHCTSCHHLLSEPPKSADTPKNPDIKIVSHDLLTKLLNATGWLSIITGVGAGIAGAVFVTDIFDAFMAFVTFVLGVAAGISGSLVSFWMTRVIQNQHDIINELRQK